MVRAARARERMETLVEDHWQVMGEFDRERRVKLAVDGMGAGTSRIRMFHPAISTRTRAPWRDALDSAINLDIFQRHADKVVMANPAQLVNTIPSRFTLTRTSLSGRQTTTCLRCTCHTRARRASALNSFREGRVYSS